MYLRDDYVTILLPDSCECERKGTFTPVINKKDGSLCMDISKSGMQIIPFMFLAKR